jgi:hypothetical protein
MELSRRLRRLPACQLRHRGQWNDKSRRDRLATGNTTKATTNDEQMISRFQFDSSSIDTRLLIARSPMIGSLSIPFRCTRTISDPEPCLSTDAVVRDRCSAPIDSSRRPSRQTRRGVLVSWSAGTAGRQGLARWGSNLSAWERCQCLRTVHSSTASVRCSWLARRWIPLAAGRPSRCRRGSSGGAPRWRRAARAASDRTSETDIPRSRTRRHANGRRWHKGGKEDSHA